MSNVSRLVFGGWLMAANSSLSGVAGVLCGVVPTSRPSTNRRSPLAPASVSSHVTAKWCHSFAPKLLSALNGTTASRRA